MSFQISLLSLPLPGISISTSSLASNDSIDISHDMKKSITDNDTRPLIQDTRRDLFHRLQQLLTCSGKRSIDIRQWDIPEFKVPCDILFSIFITFLIDWNIGCTNFYF